MGVLTDLVLPRPCVCGEAIAAPETLCRSCRRALHPAAVLARPHPAPSGMPECAVGGWYEGPLRRAIITYKERGRRDLSTVLAIVLARAVALLPEVCSARSGRAGRLLLVPVPASAAGWRARGFDHVGLLTREAVRRLLVAAPGPQVRIGWAPVLEAARRVRDQSELSAGGRRDNRAWSLRARAPLVRRAVVAQARIVLIDDVMTTGATLAEAARALQAAGLRPSGCAAIAGVRREGGEMPVPLDRGVGAVQVRGVRGRSDRLP